LVSLSFTVTPLRVAAAVSPLQKIHQARNRLRERE
jgi:hypothetical protein